MAFRALSLSVISDKSTTPGTRTKPQAKTQQTRPKQISPGDGSTTIQGGGPSATGAAPRQGRNTDHGGGGTPGGGDQMGGSRRPRDAPEGRHDHDPDQRTGKRASPKRLGITRERGPQGWGSSGPQGHPEAAAWPGGLPAREGKREESGDGGKGGRKGPRRDFGGRIGEGRGREGVER